jgi:hypothetical protein
VPEMTNPPGFPGRGALMRRIPAGLFINLLILCGSLVIADDSADKETEEKFLRGPQEKISLRLGGVLFDIDSQGQANSQSIGIGPVIDFEDFLGLDGTDDALGIRLDFRFNPKHRLEFQFAHLTQSGNKEIEDELEWDGEVYPVNTDTASIFDSKLLHATYTYSFYNNGKVDTGIAGGLSFFDFNIQIVGDVQGNSVQTDINQTLPLPSIGIFTDYAFTRKLSLYYRFTFFLASYDKYSGSVVTGEMDLQYFPWRRVGFFGGVSTFGVDLEIDPEEEDYTGTIDYSISGLGAGVIFLLGGSK